MDDDSLPLNPADEVPSSTLVDGTAEEIPPPRDGKPVKVVGVGASAGGLEALEILFSHMPNDTGMAFVVIQHLSPDFRSVMDELLARRTQMQVRMAEEGMQVERDTVYLMPRKTQMRIVEGALRLADQEQGKALLLPIDTFFQSLAEDCGERGVGVVLSGTGSDGSRGVRAIHERGGLVFAQSEESAKFDGMPRAAIETEIVDFVLPPERMPEVLLAYSGVGGLAGVEGVVKLEETEFSAIFELLKQHHGLDFHAYKPTTMRRRIERRMVLRQVRDLEAYAELLRRESDEIEALYIDLLIGVTRFFRDEAAFARIEHEVLPRLVESKDPREEIRAWVCGCATGEEAYSIAMLLKEAALQYGHDGSVKVFATDVHRRTLDRAARGVFSAESLRAVPDHLRDKYFVKDGESYRVTTELRQVVVFSEHNLTGDPPFTKIDLVSCRNLLIYLQSAAQRKAIALFHFALNVNGVLMLGPSESLGALEDEFELVDRTWKIYGKKREGRIFAGMRERPPAISTGKMVLPSVGGSRSTLDSRLARAYDQLLAHYMPPSLLVDESRRLLHTFGEVGRFFVRPEGRPSLDLIDMLTGDLRVAVAAALQRSIKEGRKVTYQGIAYEPEGGSRERLNLVIEPLEDRISSVKLYHLLFDGGPSPKAPETLAEDEVVQDFASSGEATLERIRNLELELQYSKQHLQTTVEELETSNEELQATNEELLASNEELQSTNEELHSVNEELYTVNAEYEKKNRELLELNNDIDNLLRSTEIGTLFLDENLLVRKFTPSIRAAFNLLPQDIGRSIVDITYRVKGHETLWEDASEVLHEGSSLDRKVRSLEGRDLLLRLRPYRTSTPGPGGVVLTFVDITELSRAQRELAESESRFRRITDSTPALFWLVDRDFAGEHFNAHWTELTGLPLEDLQREGWHRFIEAEDREALFAQCQSARAARERIGAEVRLHTAEGAQRWIRVTGSPRFLDENVPNGFVFSAVDIDDIRNAADRLRERVNERTRELRESEEFFRQVGEIATDGFWDLDLPTGKLYLSPSFKALFGYADETVPETLEGWERFVHPDDREPLRRALRDHLEEGAPYNLPVRYQHREGHWIWVLRRGVAIRQEDGQFRRMIGTHTDITALKETEVELARSRDRFRNVFETSIMGIGIVDRELRLTEANECLLKLIGRERAALPLPLPEISDEAGTELSKRLVREALSAGASSIAEKVYRRPDGHLVVARIGYGRLNRDSDDLVVIAEDITAAVESREALALSEA
ncbi:MAG: chemotaxis protein CheB, partial [Opitutales bacterium]